MLPLFKKCDTVQLSCQVHGSFQSGLFFPADQHVYPWLEKFFSLFRPNPYVFVKSLIFNQQDLERIAAMLEVPGLYKFSYENKDGVSAEMATHVAVWMAAREDIKGTSFPSGTIVLDLFKYYGQTVVNFKSNCNAAAKKENIYNIISYSNKDSVFTITKGEAKQQSVKINRVESLGNNNYYKVTGSVSGAKSCKKVVAVVQKNRLDTELGFSIKALKWS